MINSSNYHYLHRLAKRTAPIFHKKNRFDHIMNREKSEEANQLISDMIKSGKPFMAGRLGSTETSFLVNNLLRKNINSELSGIIQTATGKINVLWKKDSVYMNDLCTVSGFFPNDISLADKFVDIYNQCIPNIDILGVWNKMEYQLDKIIPKDAYLCKIRELEPWFYENPWSYEMKGKKVLVIHHFEDTIRFQHNQKDLLYKNSKILPDFELKTIKAVMTITGKNPEFETWFDALESMKEQIATIDFDIAIIGCAAYGLPLASFVKDLGKQAIHLGGVTQLLFGIKGKRWEEWQHYTDLRKNDGQEWIFANEIPENYKKIEGGCYW